MTSAVAYTGAILFVNGVLFQRGQAGAALHWVYGATGGLINGARMQRVPAQRRPQYHSVERMAILQLRAMRGWNKTETARHFFVSDDTVRAWLQRAEDDSLVQTNSPVNRLPDFIRHAVQQIQLFCPTLGKVKIADKLAGAELHIGKSTVARILQEKPLNAPKPTTCDANKLCRIVSKYPGRTWHADLTAVPISGGFSANWIPNAIAPQRSRVAVSPASTATTGRPNPRRQGRDASPPEFPSRSVASLHLTVASIARVHLEWQPLTQ